MGSYSLTKLSSLNACVYLHGETVSNIINRQVCAHHMMLLQPRLSKLAGHYTHVQRQCIVQHKHGIHTSAGRETLHSKTCTGSWLSVSKYLTKHYRHSRHLPVLSAKNIIPRHYHWLVKDLGHSPSEKLSLCVCTHRRMATKASRFTWTNNLYRSYLESLIAEYEAIQERRRHDAQKAGDYNQNILSIPIVTLLTELKVKYEELSELGVLLKDTDMKSMAEEDMEVCQATIEEMETTLFDLLTSKSATDNHDIMLEVTGGAGGQESMLFAKEIFHMYANYAAYKGWQFDVAKLDTTDIGGFRFASATVSGPLVYHTMKYESGVHRVQRVPRTETAGRVHTSTISVAIIPQATEIDVVLNPKDLKVDTYTSTGGGGQHVNKTDSAVRITHLPTGTIAACQDTRSQIENRKLALQTLRSRIYNNQLAEQLSKERYQRKLQIGHKDRSEKIRTYNFQQSRITDHRLGENSYGMENFLKGTASLDEMIEGLQFEARKENLEITLNEFQDNTKKVSKRSKR